MAELPGRGVRAERHRPTSRLAALAGLESPLSSLNTTIAVVATDAALSPAACRQVASTAHDGLARTIRPAHTPVDGDTVFALATGAIEVPPPADMPAAFSPETAAGHRGGQRGGGLSGPRGGGRRDRRGLGGRHPDLSWTVARSIRPAPVAWTQRGLHVERQLGMTNQSTPARQPKKRSAFVVGGATILSFVALLYLVEAFDQLNGHRLDDNGIRPLETDGLWGILFAPLLHANWAHLAANTGPALVLGFLVTLAGLSRFLWATAIVWILGGFGTWLIGNLGSPCGETDHIGASGLIFGWLTFLLVFGFFTRSGLADRHRAGGAGRLRRSAVGRRAGAQRLRRRVLAGASLRWHRRGARRLPAVQPGTRSQRAAACSGAAIIEST